VVDRGLAVNAGAWYSGTNIDMSRLGLYATPSPGTSLDALEVAINEVIAKIARDGVSAAELDRAKTRLVADVVYAQDNQARLARMYGAGIVTGNSVEDIRDWPERVRAVSVDAVQAAAREWLEARRSVTARLLPASTPTEKRS
jgi:zinc protease